MRSKRFLQQAFHISSFLFLFLSACTPRQEATVTPSIPLTTPEIAPTELPILTATPSGQWGLVVALVKDGNILLWDEASGQARTIIQSGDITAVTMSEDGRVIAFLRRVVIQLSEVEWFEQSSLWAADWNGGNPRELVSAESLRQRLSAAERESTNISQMEWVPGTHQLLFSAWTYIVQAEGESHAIPKGLYLVDADARTDKELVPVSSSLRFVPSPNGQQIALMSQNSLSFINVDGSNLRSDVLTSTPIGRTAPVFPTGVWTQDSTAFVITGSLENDPSFNTNFTIWRISVDGSSSEIISTITASDPNSVTFSPDGQHAAFVQFTQGQLPSEWYIASFYGRINPLAIPQDYDFDSRNASIHWSPDGNAFTRNLRKLCPEATRDRDECDTRINLSGTVAAIHWIDGNRVSFLTREPATLFLGKMDFTGNMSGSTIPIMTWPLETWVNSRSFTAANVNP